ncbi:DUF2231 domain-containing protein [soil metagenome]
METRSPTFPVRFSDRPLYSFLVQFPVVCFVGTWLSDLAYWRTQLFVWETFSVWMVAVGCVMAGLAGIVGLFCFFGDRRARAWKLAWPHALASLLAALLSVVNAFVHSRDGYTAVVPDGLMLSSIVLLVMAAALWMGSVRTGQVASTGAMA